MANFMVSLWESVFTPGPTPTLLLATNFAFGALQLVLLSLLVATYSIHFVVLSVLCGGLWFGINWFTAELARAKAAETGAEGEKKREGEGKGGVNSSEKRRERQKSPESVGSDTETEMESTGQTTGAARTQSVAVERKKIIPNPAHRPTVRPDSVTRPEESASGERSAASSGLLDPEAAKGMSDSALGRRRKSLGESSTDASTDSEWEKVSEGEGR